MVDNKQLTRKSQLSFPLISATQFCRERKNNRKGNLIRQVSSLHWLLSPFGSESISPENKLFRGQIISRPQRIASFKQKNWNLFNGFSKRTKNYFYSLSTITHYFINCKYLYFFNYLFVLTMEILPKVICQDKRQWLYFFQN